MTAASRSIVFCAIGIALCVSGWAPLLAAERGAPGATLDSVVSLARQVNPDLAAAALEADSAAYKVGAAGALPDPTVALEAWDVDYRGVGQRRVGVEQEFKLWGKRDLERGVAVADAEAARHQSRAIETDLLARVKIVYAQYGAAHKAVELSLSLKRHIDETLNLLRLRYGATSVDQQDVIKAELEAATAEAEVVRLQGEAKSAAARLNALIGRASQSALAIPKNFRPLKSKLTLAGVQAVASQANPMLAATDAQVNSAASAKDLADLNYYPDVTLGARFVQRPRGNNSGEFLLGFKVPLQFEAKDAEQLTAGSKLEAAQARNEATRLKLDGEVAEAWFGLESVRKVIRVYEQRQLPPARLSVETARTGFQAGTTDLAALFEAERRLRAVEIELLKLRVEEQTKYAELERLVGGFL
jgi:outer membrane protein, heavy metal efflux system